jgi:hypothetical protein
LNQLTLSPITPSSQFVSHGIRLSSTKVLDAAQMTAQISRLKRIRIDEDQPLYSGRRQQLSAVTANAPHAHD